jgi:hypothetical protein
LYLFPISPYLFATGQIIGEPLLADCAIAPLLVPAKMAPDSFIFENLVQLKHEIASWDRTKIPLFMVKLDAK